MEPTILDQPALTLCGILTPGKPDQLNYEQIWREQFNPREDQIRPYSPDKAYYGAWLSDATCGQAYLAGMAVKDLPALPAGCVLRSLPAARYAVFPCSIPTISATYTFIYGQWLPASPYELDETASDYEYYPPEPDKTAIYVPIRLKEKQAA